MSRLYAVADNQKSNQQEAREAVQQYREKQIYRPPLGQIVGERICHRGWPPEVVLAFLAAPVIRPEKGEIARKLYARRNSSLKAGSKSDDSDED